MKYRTEQEKKGIDTIPLIPKRIVLEYLDNGENGGSGYKEGNIPIVSVTNLRTMLLQAGYTELALSRAFFGTHTDLVQSKRFPESQSERLSLTIHTTNKYGLPKNRTYDAIQAVEFIVENFEPDLPEGKDDLRNMVLSKIQELEKLKLELVKSEKKFLSLSRWAFTLTGEVIFWLNPIDQKKYSYGWYTLDELKSWLSDDPECSVLKSNRKKEARPRKRHTFKADYKKALRTYSTSGRTNKRLLKISLMGCPFPDLVKRYSSGAN